MPRSLRECAAPMRFSRRSSIHFTGRPERARRQHDRALLAEHEHLLAEPATDVAGDDVDVRLRQLEVAGEEVARAVHRLGGGDHVQLVATGGVQLATIPRVSIGNAT